LLCPRALASCGSLDAPKSRKITTAIIKSSGVPRFPIARIVLFITSSFQASPQPSLTIVRLVKEILPPCLISAAKITHDLPVDM
jgi:hypothetical protein